MVCGMNTTARTTVKTWGAGPVEAALLPRAPYDVAYTPERTVAGFAFDIQCGQHAFAGDRLRPFTTMPHSLALTPAGCDIRSASETGGEYLTVTITPGSESRYVEMFDAARLYQRSNAANPAGRKIAQQLRRQLLSAARDDAATEEAAVRLFEVAVAADVPNAKPATSITPARLRQFHDLLEARFADALSVTEMASTLGLSVAYFIRAFTAATGTTPHACLMDRRISAARQALANTAMPMAAVALAAGFSSQAHMASVFRARLGITPGAYRAAAS